MKTNYQNLNRLEALAVVIASIGIFLVGVIAFNALDSKQQNNIALALNIFDLHEDFVEQGGLIKTVLIDAPQDVLDEFYIAFAQTMVLPDESLGWWQTVGQQTTLAFNNALEFSDRTAIAFHRMVEENNKILSPQTGQVAGITIEVPVHEETYIADPDVLVNIVPDNAIKIKPQTDPRAYGYIPPSIPPELREMINPIKF